MDWKEIKTVDELDMYLDKKIQKNRIHQFHLKIIDVLGRPSKKVKVRAVHKNHDFTFGVCPNGHISMTNRLACGEGKEAEAYWKLIGDLFNGTTLWWGWRVLEPQRGVHTFEDECDGFGPMKRMLERAEGLCHKITAHAILYPNADVSPEWLSECTQEEAVWELEKHVKTTVEKYKNRISCWHPVNEAYQEIQEVGALRVNEGLLYRWISDMAPHASIVDNGGHTIAPDFYQKGISNAELFGGRVDDLGVRGYFELYNENALAFYRDLWKHFCNLAKRYGKGVRFTEIGATSAPRKGKYSPWDVDHTTAAQLGITNFDEYRSKQSITEETQAKFLVRMYRMAFAHPDVKECTYWDLCDSYTWNKVEGGLVRADLTPKPAYFKLKELIHDIWSTDVELESDSDGICRFEGFDGEYEISIENKKYRIHFNCEETEKVIIV